MNFAKSLEENLADIKNRMERAAQKCGRSAYEIFLLPVSKGHDLATIKEALGQKHFPRALGENYLEEFSEKQNALESTSLEWHYIGRVQSRKLQEIARLADVIQSLSRAQEIKKLASFKLKKMPRLLIQVNVSGEVQKGGCDPCQLESLIAVAKQHQIQISGLMCLPTPSNEHNEGRLRMEFSQLRELRDRHVPGGILSMGMSDDFEWAIEEGSTLIRVGTKLFGPRLKR